MGTADPAKNHKEFDGVGSRAHRVVVGVGVIASVVAAALIGWWAGHTALDAPDDPLSTAEPILYEVAMGTVGRFLEFSSVAEWDLIPVGSNNASGVVTSTELNGSDEVHPGQIIYHVNLRPVVVLQGEIPAFRDLGVGSKGADVVQLQTFLASAGFFEHEIDGKYGQTTRQAVIDWRKSFGGPGDGDIRFGDVIFVPDLPGHFTLADGIHVRTILHGGEDLLLAVPASPEFRIPLAVEQRDLVPLTAAVTVEYPHGVWNASIAKAVEDPTSGALTLVLQGSDGGPVCGDACAQWVDIGFVTTFRVRLEVVPEVTGLVVPIGALRGDPANEQSVLSAGGESIPVSIVASAHGLAVVEGLEPGELIVLLDTSQQVP